MVHDDDDPVAVIGAGGSGILAAAALRRAGVAFEVLEARGGVGGTWRYDADGDGSACYASLVANTSKLRMSPGARRIPGRPWHYASHAEMLAYLEGLTDAEALRAHMRFGWRVAEARPCDVGWLLTSGGGEQRRYRAVVCALGVNGRPRWQTSRARSPASSCTAPSTGRRPGSRTGTS
jgi:cation diffusion facilitator CzcD-associated flavoprotein CzcO